MSDEKELFGERTKELREKAATGDDDAREELLDVYVDLTDDEEHASDVVDEMIESTRERLERSTFENAVELAEMFEDEDGHGDVAFDPQDTDNDVRGFIEAYPWDDGTTEQMLDVLDRWDDASANEKHAFSYVYDMAVHDTKEVLG